MKVSVIIPYKHVDIFLKRCIESYTFGIESNVEIILVPLSNQALDEAENITTAFQEKIVIFKEVCGNSKTARNIGLDMASGDYIVFPNPCDWVTGDFCQQIHTVNASKHFDLVIFSYQIRKKRKQFTNNIADYRKMDCSVNNDNTLLPIWNKAFWVQTVRNHNLRFDIDSDIAELDFVQRFLEANFNQNIAKVKKSVYYHFEKYGYKFSPDKKIMAREKLAALKCFKFTNGNLWNYFGSCVKQKYNDIIEKHFTPFFQQLESTIITKKEHKRRKILKREISHFRKADIPDGISIISQNCIGGIIYHDLMRENLSPTINVFFEAPDFMNFVLNLQKYLDKEMKINWFETYPIGTLGDIHIYFRHDITCTDALNAWNRRKGRVRLDRVVVLCSDRFCFDDEVYITWETIQYPKLLYTCHKKYAGLNAVYFPRYRFKKYIPNLIPFREFYKDDKLLSVLKTLQKE